MFQENRSRESPSTLRLEKDHHERSDGRTQPAGGRRERSRAQIPHGAAVTGATGEEFSGKIRVPILVLHKAVLYVKGVIVKNAMNSS